MLNIKQKALTKKPNVTLQVLY